MGGGVTTISFPDGNVWKKETGIIGVYKDGFDPALLRVIRKEKGNKFTVDLIDGIDAISISAKGGAPKVIFDFPGKPNVPGLVDPKKIPFLLRMATSGQSFNYVVNFL